MNKLLIYLFVAIFPVMGIHAQSYTVYSVTGRVTMAGNKSSPRSVKPRSVLRDADRITIGMESAVTIIDEKNNRMHSLTLQGTDNVRSLIIKEKNKTKNLSREYVSYLVKQLFSKGSMSTSHPGTYMHATATSFRATSNDSLLVNRIVGYVVQQVTMVGFSPEEALYLDPREIGTDFNVEFDLISHETGEPVASETASATSCYIRVKNKEAFPIYVNILNIDKDGTKYLVLPVDEAALCAHLLVPPETTVRFMEDPFILPDDVSKEMFMLVATQEPVDFSILMNPMKIGNAGVMRVGIHRKFVKTQKQ